MRSNATSRIGPTTSTPDPEDLKKRLQVQFPKSDAIPRPVKVQAWDGKKKPIRYMMKAKFFRRIGTNDGERFTGGRKFDGQDTHRARRPIGHRTCHSRFAVDPRHQQPFD
jgi:hypothetical protein